MKIKLSYTIVLFLFFPFVVYSQGDRGRIDPANNIPFFVQGIVLDGYNVYGILNTTLSTISNMSDVNPASLVDHQSPAIGFSMQFDSKIDREVIPLVDAGQQRANPWLPQSFNFVYPKGDFRFGMGFHQKYNQYFDFDLIITTPNDPTGGEAIKATFETNLYTGSGVASYSFPSPFHKSHQATLGFQLNLNYLRDFETLRELYAKATDIALGWTLGLRYDFNDRFKANIAFDKENTFSGTPKTNRSLVTLEDSSFVQIPVEQRFIANYPDKLKLGLLVKITDQIWLTNNFAITFWNDINENIKNQPEFSGNFIFNITSTFTTSIGIYYTNNQTISDFFRVESDLLFLNGGLKIDIKKLTLEMSIADSHLGSSENREQTIVKFGTGITL